jgi:hypothetical protein
MGIISVCVVHVPGIGFIVSVPAGGMAIGAGFVGTTGVGVPMGGGLVGGGFVGGGLVGGGSVGGFVPPDATFVPLLYVQPFSAAATTRIINAIDTFFILGTFLLSKSFRKSCHPERSEGSQPSTSPELLRLSACPASRAKTE